MPIFSVSALDVNLSPEIIGLQCRLHEKKPIPGVKLEEKENQTVPSIFREDKLLLDGFLRDIDSRNHAINPVRLDNTSDLWCIKNTVRCTPLHSISTITYNDIDFLHRTLLHLLPHKIIRVSQHLE